MSNSNAPALLDGAGKNDELAAAGRKLALAVYVILKNASIYDLGNHVWDRPLGAMAEVMRWHFGEGVGKPLALSSVEKALFLNRTLVRLDSSTYGAMKFVSRAFDQLDIAELSFLAPLAADDLRPLVATFREAIRARSGAPLIEASLPGIRVTRRIEKDLEVIDGDKIDPKLAAVTAYASAVATCAEFRGLFLSGGNPSLVRLKRAAQELVTTALRHPDLLVGLTQLARVRGTAAGHMTNCAAFALLLSRKLELPRRSYGELALNAMLAPLGVSESSPQTDAARRSSNPPSGAPRMSAAVAMMRRYGAIARPALVRSAIVHERGMPRDGSDGQTSGAYRLGMKPHLFSRVIAVAAAYDLENQTALPDEALRRIVARTTRTTRTTGMTGTTRTRSRDPELDPDVVALLSEVLGLYPVGSTVRLDDGNVAVVVQAPRDPSKRALPVVRVLRGDGSQLVDLAAMAGRLRIVATVAPESQQINVTHCFLL